LDTHRTGHGRNVTQLLRDLREGQRDAQDGLLALVYDELRALAHRQLTTGQRPTLTTTVVVHEAYLKLFDQTRLVWDDRRHFFAVAALAMRQIIVDHARHKRAAKRGRGQEPLDIDVHEVPVEDRADDILALDEALTHLASIDERLAHVVELRYFGGLTVDETAEVLEVDARTVSRDWRKARALLHASLTGIREE